MGKAGEMTSQLEPFVYADVIDDPNGMPLTVISALSRAGLDPWSEAQNLSTLAPDLAADRLARTLRRLPVMQATRVDASLIAGRLIDLLPKAVPALATGPAGAVPSIPKIPKPYMMLMLGFMVAGLLAPLLGPSKTDTVAPASWLSEPPPAVSESASPAANTPAPASAPASDNVPTGQPKAASASS